MIDDALMGWLALLDTLYDHGTACRSCKHQYVGKQNTAET